MAAAANDKNLTIEREQGPQGVVILRLYGSLSSMTFDRLESELKQILLAGKFNVIIDGSNVGYVSSAGAGVLMNAFIQSQENHGKLIVCHASQSLQETFDLLNLTNVIPVAPDVATALSMMQGA